MTEAALTGSSARPSGLAEAFHYVCVVFRPQRRMALEDIPAGIAIKYRRRYRDGLLQRLLRFRGPTHLAERRGEYSVGARTIGE